MYVMSALCNEVWFDLNCRFDLNAPFDLISRQCCTPPYFKKLGGVFPKYAAAAAYAGVESSELFQIFVPCKNLRYYIYSSNRNSGN